MQFSKYTLGVNTCVLPVSVVVGGAPFVFAATHASANVSMALWKSIVAGVIQCQRVSVNQSALVIVIVVWSSIICAGGVTERKCTRSCARRGEYNLARWRHRHNCCARSVRRSARHPRKVAATPVTSRKTAAVQRPPERPDIRTTTICRVYRKRRLLQSENARPFSAVKSRGHARPSPRRSNEWVQGRVHGVLVGGSGVARPHHSQWTARLENYSSPRIHVK